MILSLQLQDGLLASEELRMDDNESVDSSMWRMNCIQKAVGQREIFQMGNEFWQEAACWEIKEGFEKLVIMIKL